MEPQSKCVCSHYLHWQTWMRSLAAIGAVSMMLAGEAGRAEGLEHLGQPCRAKQVLAGRVVVDRADGRERFVLTNDNETQGSELVVIDFEKDTGEMYVAPAGAGSWALNEVKGDRLVVGTFYDGTFMVFDLKQMKFVKTVKFPGEDYIWNLAVGSDGRIYGGTYPGGKLGAMDLDTYAFEDCGAPAPPNLYLSGVSATPEGLILCAFGQKKPVALIYDPETKKFTPLPKQLEGVSGGIAWNGYFLSGSRAFKGKSFETVDPLPFPTPPADKGGWGVDAYMTTPDVLYLRQGNAVYRYARGDSKLTFIADIPLRGGRLMAGTSKGELLGVRGQDYFVIKPGDTDLKLRPIPVEGRGRPTLFLEADPRGRLWGGPHFGQTLFYLDPQTKKAVNTGVVCDAGGEVYDVTFLDGKVYTASYAGGDITCYDPETPWDQWHLKNPKPLTAVGPAYIRPTGGIITGPDRKLYSGWMAQYGKYGGAIAITDPDTGKTELIENPLGEQAVEGLAVDGRFAYVGTSLTANGLEAKEGESPRFGVIDLASKKAIFQREFEGAQSVRRVVYDIKTKRAAMIIEGKLHVFDTQKREFVSDFPGDLPRVTGYTMTTPGDGKVYLGSEKTVLIVDLASGKATPLAEAPDTITNVTVGPDRTVYISCKADVYRVVSE